MQAVDKVMATEEQIFVELTDHQVLSPTKLPSIQNQAVAIVMPDTVVLANEHPLAVHGTCLPSMGVGALNISTFIYETALMFLVCHCASLVGTGPQLSTQQL